MSNREAIIAAMAAEFDALPQWLREPFEPFRETVALLMERRQEELARHLIAAIPVPAGFDPDQVAAFSSAVSSILSSIDAIIAGRTCNQPEYIAAYEASVQARLAQ